MKRLAAVLMMFVTMTMAFAHTKEEIKSEITAALETGVVTFEELYEGYEGLVADIDTFLKRLDVSTLDEAAEKINAELVDIEKYKETNESYYHYCEGMLLGDKMMINSYKDSIIVLEVLKEIR